MAQFNIGEKTTRPAKEIPPHVITFEEQAEKVMFDIENPHDGEGGMITMALPEKWNQRVKILSNKTTILEGSSLLDLQQGGSRTPLSSIYGREFPRQISETVVSQELPGGYTVKGSLGVVFKMQIRVSQILDPEGNPVEQGDLPKHLYVDNRSTS